MPVFVGDINDITVDNGHGAYTSAADEFGGIRSHAAHAYNQHMPVLQALDIFFSDQQGSAFEPVQVNIHGCKFIGMGVAAMRNSRPVCIIAGMRSMRPLLLVFVLCGLLAAGAVWFRGCIRPPAYTRFNGPLGKGGPEALEKNWGRDIEKAAEKHRIPAAFLKALCMLESSGRKPVPARFEEHVYTRLKLVKAGLRGSYEHVTRENLRNASDEAIQNLASSWGPFQLMGYKCLLLGIEVKDIRGDDAIEHGVRWIDMTYGKYLRQGRYEDAFHIHNAGRPVPSSGRHLTHDPKYVANGMRWMRHFNQ